jgi:calcium permeable stress-gated cation channel
MHTRIVAALIIYQITMFGFMGIKKFIYAPFLLPLIPISFTYALITKKRFYKSFAVTPLEVAAGELKEMPNMEAIYAAYIPLCLKPEKLEDVELFEDAQSHVASRTTSF